MYPGARGSETAGRKKISDIWKRRGGRLPHIIAIAIALIIILVIAGGVIINDAIKTQNQGFSNTTGDGADALFQVSTIDALSSGLYDGVATVGEIRQRGDFGSGTFEGLDGELIALDETVYQATIRWDR